MSDFDAPGHVRRVDRQIPQQIRVNRGLRASSAQVGTGIDRCDPHLLHVPLGRLTIDVQLGRDFA